MQPSQSDVTGGVQHDERGRSYLLKTDGTRYYLSPTTEDPNAVGAGGGFFHDRERWNTSRGEYEPGGFNWGNLLSAGVGGLLGAGALGAAGAFGGSGGATAGSGASLLGEGGVAAGLPTAGMAPGLIGGAGGGAGSGIGSVLTRLGLTAGMMGLGRAIGGGGQTQIPPEIQQILDLQKQRMQMQNPLFEAITRLAMSRLPTAQQQPISGGGLR